MNETEMTFEIAASMGLSADEWELILNRLARTPNLCELGIFSAMWSEHCSYKSSKKWLKTLPVDGPQVIDGPGENAGAVDIADGLAAIVGLITPDLISDRVNLTPPAEVHE